MNYAEGINELNLRAYRALLDTRSDRYYFDKINSTQIDVSANIVIYDYERSVSQINYPIRHLIHFSGYDNIVIKIECEPVIFNSLLVESLVKRNKDFINSGITYECKRHSIVIKCIILTSIKDDWLPPIRQITSMITKMMDLLLSIIEISKLLASNISKNIVYRYLDKGYFNTSDDRDRYLIGKCDEGHEYFCHYSLLADTLFRDNKVCPICLQNGHPNRVVPFYNDLMTEYWYLEKYFDIDQFSGLDLHAIPVDQNKEYQFICPRHKERYTNTLEKESDHMGCPLCEEECKNIPKIKE